MFILFDLFIINCFIIAIVYCNELFYNIERYMFEIVEKKIKVLNKLNIKKKNKYAQSIKIEKYKELNIDET